MALKNKIENSCKLTYMIKIRQQHLHDASALSHRDLLCTTDACASDFKTPAWSFFALSKNQRRFLWNRNPSGYNEESTTSHSHQGRAEVWFWRRCWGPVAQVGSAEGSPGPRAAHRGTWPRTENWEKDCWSPASLEQRRGQDSNETGIQETTLTS